jgi:hypothetical protein
MLRTEALAVEAVRRSVAPTTPGRRLINVRAPHTVCNIVCGESFISITRPPAHGDPFWRRARTGPLFARRADLMHVGRLGNLGPRALSSQPQLAMNTQAASGPFHRPMRIIVSSARRSLRRGVAGAQLLRHGGPRSYERHSGEQGWHIR